MFKFVFTCMFLFCAAFPAQAGEALNVFAAASLKNAIDDIATSYKKAHGTKVLTTYAASGALARQIEAGAPADIYISANSAWIHYLEDKKIICPSCVTNLLTNKLVLIAPVQSPVEPLNLLETTDLLPFLNDGHLAIADAKAAPAGKYAIEALKSLKLEKSLIGHFAQGRNVRDALRLVAVGEAPLGIVYASDAKADPMVKVLAQFPPASHKPIVYPMALINSTTHLQSHNFADFLQSQDAAKIFIRHGFGVIGNNP